MRRSPGERSGCCAIPPGEALVGDELFAIGPRILARSFGGVAPQQDEQRLDIVHIGVFALGKHALDHLPFEPARYGVLALELRGAP